VAEKHAHIQRRSRRFNVGPGSWEDRFTQSQTADGELMLRVPKSGKPGGRS
jgi:hypothetical protein